MCQPQRSHGHSCDHVTICCQLLQYKTYDIGGHYHITYGVKPSGIRDESADFSSFAYTQTIVRLYANNLSPIPKLKRLFGAFLPFYRQVLYDYRGEHITFCRFGKNNWILSEQNS